MSNLLMTSPSILPKTAWEWVIYLKEKLEATPVHSFFIQSSTLSTAKALFQLILTGSVKGKDLWETTFQQTIPQATFLKNVRISFGFQQRKANENEKLVYLQIWASLIRRRFRLDQLLPSEFFGSSTGAWIEDTFNRQEEQKVTEDHVCFHLSLQYLRKEGKFKEFRKVSANRHQFLCLWSWWVLNNVQHLPHLPLHVDLLLISKVAQDAGYQDLVAFVSGAS